MSLVPSPPWTCPSCDTALSSGRFCAACGERRLEGGEHTLRGWIAHHRAASRRGEGRFGRTLRALVFRPGELTAAHVAGKRQPFLGPFRLFLTCNAVFFVVQGLTALRILATPFSVHRTGMSYSELARRMIDAHVAATGIELAKLAEAFDRREETIAKALVVLMVPFLALATAIAFPRSGFVKHIVFALHFYAATLAFLVVLFPLAALGLSARQALWGPATRETYWWFDTIVSWIEVFWNAGYLGRSVRRVYGMRGPGLWIVVGLLTCTVIATFFAHRFLIFWITLRTL